MTLILQKSKKEIKKKIKDRQIMNHNLNETGKRIQNYVFNFSDFLGAGNFSKCYKGFNEVTKEIVAIKIIELNSLKSKKLEELLFQEIQILKKLKHPSVLKCYEIFTSNRNCYIITELCNQGNLENHLRVKRTFQQNEANPIIKDVYEGLLYLAQNNIVHRDLKSANIFLHNDRAKIADFGFAKQINHNFKDLNIGSPLYMAPEGIVHNIYGPKTQVWALGILVYELFHGSSPYINCKTEQQLKRSITIPISWNQLRRDLSQDIKQFILICLEINEQKRPTIEQLSNTGYIRRLNQIDFNLMPNKLDVRSHSKSFNLLHPNKQSQKFFKPIQYERVNNNFRPPVDIPSREASRSSNNQKKTAFRSVNMRSNNRHNTFDFHSPKRQQVLGHPNMLSIHSPSSRKQQIQYSQQKVILSTNLNHYSSNQGVSNPITPLNSYNVQYQVFKQTAEKLPIFYNSINQKPGEVVYGDGVPPQQINKRPLSSYQGQNIQQNKIDLIGYNSTNGFLNVGNQMQNNENLINLQYGLPSNQQSGMKMQYSNFNFGQSVSSFVFKQKVSFKQAIFFIHHCRLIYKFLYLYKDTSYFSELIYLKIFQYLMALLIELTKFVDKGGLKIEGEKASIKAKKFRQVSLEYLVKYRKDLQQNNYNISLEPVSCQSLNETSSTLRRLFTVLNEDIANIKKKNHFSLTEENLIILGHLCIVIIGSLRQIEEGIELKAFNRLLQFKDIEVILNTPKENFTLSSYKTYYEKFIV